MNYKALFKAIGAALLVLISVGGVCLLLVHYPISLLVIYIFTLVVWLVKLLYDKFNNNGNK